MTHLARSAIRLAPLLLGATLPFTAQAQTVGVTAVVRNDVKLANPTAHKASVREKVALGNQITTGSASMAQLLLLDKTSFTVGAKGRVTIDRFVYDPSSNTSSMAATVAKGAFRFMSSKAMHKKPGESKITTPVASIGIRGTIIEGTVGFDALCITDGEPGVPKGTKGDNKTATLIILRGPGPNAQGEPEGAIDIDVNGTIITLNKPGQALLIPGEGMAPVGPFQLSAKGANLMRVRLAAAGGPDIDPWTDDLLTDRQFQNVEERFIDGPIISPIG